MVEEKQWSDTWEWKKKTFIRCLKCKKAMPTEYKDKHECQEAPEGKPKNTQGTLDNTPKNQPTVEDITNSGVEIMRKCFEEVGNITGRKPVQGDDVRMVNSLFIFITREMGRK